MFFTAIKQKIAEVKRYVSRIRTDIVKYEAKTFQGYKLNLIAYTNEELDKLYSSLATKYFNDKAVPRIFALLLRRYKATFNNNITAAFSRAIDSVEGALGKRRSIEQRIEELLALNDYTLMEFAKEIRVKAKQKLLSNKHLVFKAKQNRYADEQLYKTNFDAIVRVKNVKAFKDYDEVTVVLVKRLDKLEIKGYVRASRNNKRVVSIKLVPYLTMLYNTVNHNFKRQFVEYVVRTDRTKYKDVDSDQGVKRKGTEFKDLFLISNPVNIKRTCATCKFVSGKVLTKDAVDYAKTIPKCKLFHPNCRHSLQPVSKKFNGKIFTKQDLVRANKLGKF